MVSVNRQTKRKTTVQFEVVKIMNFEKMPAFRCDSLHQTSEINAKSHNEIHHVHNQERKTLEN